MLPDYIFSEGNVIYPSANMYDSLMMAITLQLKNVIPDSVSVDQDSQNEVTLLMPCAL